jgi:hypothetical protein
MKGDDSMEKGFIEVTNGRWWYEDKVGEVLRIHREIENYADEALEKPERAFEVIDEEHGYCRVLARDCKDWTLPKLKQEFVGTPGPETDVDMVNHPSHYTYGKFEVIEVIEEVTKSYDDAFMGYCIGNAQKYIARAPHKGTMKQDLEKARKYLEFSLKYLEGKQ